MLLFEVLFMSLVKLFSRLLLLLRLFLKLLLLLLFLKLLLLLRLFLKLLLLLLRLFLKLLFSSEAVLRLLGTEKGGGLEEGCEGLRG